MTQMHTTCVYVREKGWSASRRITVIAQEAAAHGREQNPPPPPKLLGFLHFQQISRRLQHWPHSGHDAQRSGGQTNLCVAASLLSDETLTLFDSTLQICSCQTWTWGCTARAGGSKAARKELVKYKTLTIYLRITSIINQYHVEKMCSLNSSVSKRGVMTPCRRLKLRGEDAIWFPKNLIEFETA